VGASLRDKAANRATQYRTAIDARFAEGDFRGGLHEAERWLLGELQKVARQRPKDAPAVYRDVAESLARLAEAVPFYKPTQTTAKGGVRDGAA
jgi:hypothetical protein